MKIYERSLQALLPAAPRSRVLARLASLAQVARRACSQAMYDCIYLMQTTLRKHPFLLALLRWGRFAQRNVCDSQTETPSDDVNEYIKNKSGSHWVPNANSFNFTFLLVDFGKVLW